MRSIVAAGTPSSTVERTASSPRPLTASVMCVDLSGALLLGRTQIDPKARLCPQFETRFRILPPRRKLAQYRLVQLRWMFPQTERQQAKRKTASLLHAYQ